MFRATAFALLTALAALTTAGDLAAQIVTKSVTKHGTWCIYFRYCFTLDNRGNGNFVGSFEVDFPHSAADIDGVMAPPGWTAAVVPAAGGRPAKVVFTAGPFARMAPGAGPLGGFCVETNCWPRSLEGLQAYRVFVPGGEGGRPDGSGDCSFDPAENSNLLYGDALGLHGSSMLIAATDQDACDDLALVLVGLPMAVPLGIPGLGELYIDPTLILPLAPIALDPLGVGQMQLPIPPDPNLGGTRLMLQSVTIAAGPELSNDWPIEIR